MPKEEKDYRTNDNLIIGRNAVIELLKSGREVENVLVAILILSLVIRVVIVNFGD